MPIKIADSLPATTILENENIFVMTEYRAMHQDIRPLNVLILNLMPTKVVTETQLLRKLSNTPLQVNVEFLQTASYTPQHTDSNHMEAFYTTFDKIKDRNFDGMIITGAPLDYIRFLISQNLATECFCLFPIQKQNQARYCHKTSDSSNSNCKQNNFPNLNLQYPIRYND